MCNCSTDDTRRDASDKRAPAGINVGFRVTRGFLLYAIWTVVAGFFLAGAYKPSLTPFNRGWMFLAAVVSFATCSIHMHLNELTHYVDERP